MLAMYVAKSTSSIPASIEFLVQLLNVGGIKFVDTQLILPTTQFSNIFGFMICTSICTNYIVSCLGNVPSFTTTDNTTRSYTITNLTTMTTYTFSVVATIGSGNDMPMATSPTGDINSSTTSVSSKVINVTV